MGRKSVLSNCSCLLPPIAKMRSIRRMGEKCHCTKSLRDSGEGRLCLSINPRERSWVAEEAPCLDDRVSSTSSKTGVAYDKQILNLLADLQREFGLTYILISHNLAVVEHIATRVAVMYLGRIVEENETEALFRAPRHPYTKALLASVLTPEPGLGVPDTGLGLAFPNPLEPPPGCTFHPRCPDAGPRCRVMVPRDVRDGELLVACHLHDGGTDMVA
jgi:oligopeptide/dipeptide ABC transporter ATP-binding protein